MRIRHWRGNWFGLHHIRTLQKTCDTCVGTTQVQIEDEKSLRLKRNSLYQGPSQQNEPATVVENHQWHRAPMK